MGYTKIKNMDNPLIIKGKKWHFLNFFLNLRRALDYKNMYSKKYSLKCRIFTVTVSGNYLKPKIGYLVYNEG